MLKIIKAKFEKHFKVAVQCKDVVSFENELNNKGLDFCLDRRNESYKGSLVFYNLLQKDKPVVDAFLNEKGIIADYQAFQFDDFGDQKKFMNLYLKLMGVFIVLLVLLKAIEEAVSP